MALKRLSYLPSLLELGLFAAKALVTPSLGAGLSVFLNPFAYLLTYLEGPFDDLAVRSFESVFSAPSLVTPDLLLSGLVLVPSLLVLARLLGGGAAAA